MIRFNSNLPTWLQDMTGIIICLLSVIHPSLLLMSPPPLRIFSTSHDSALFFHSRVLHYFFSFASSLFLILHFIIFIALHRYFVTYVQLDFEWYLGNQILPPISRLCEPIEGTSAAEMSVRLGLDASK